MRSEVASLEASGHVASYLSSCCFCFPEAIFGTVFLKNEAEGILQWHHKAEKTLPKTKLEIVVPSKNEFSNKQLATTA